MTRMYLKSGHLIYEVSDLLLLFFFLVTFGEASFLLLIEKKNFRSVRNFIIFFFSFKNNLDKWLSTYCTLDY